MNLATGERRTILAPEGYGFGGVPLYVTSSEVALMVSDSRGIDRTIFRIPLAE